MIAEDLRRAWERFFFAPVSPINIALYRILLGLVALNYGALLAPDLMEWFGPTGILPFESSRMIPGGGGWINLFLVFNDSAASIVVIFTIFMMAAAFMTVGFLTRPSTCVVFVCLATFHHRNALIVNSSDAFMRLATFFLMFSQAGAALSVDRLLGLARGHQTGRPAPCAPWAMRMIQLQLSILYLSAFLWKSRGPLWIDGTALYYTARLPEFFRFPVPYVFEHMWTVRLCTWGAMAVELSMATAVWIKGVRYWVLAGGVLLHTGISYSMNIPQFSAVMVSAYILWVEPSDLARWFRWPTASGRRKKLIPVFYDGNCSFCVRSLKVLQALNILNRLRFLDIHGNGTLQEFADLDLERGTKELLVYAPDGRWLGGFYAFRHMARHLPLGWIVLPFLYLPLAGAIGSRIYQFIAIRRTCILPPFPQKTPR